MAPSDEELVRAVVTRWEEGDFEPRADQIHLDIEIFGRARQRAFQGHGGVRRWRNDLERSFDEWKLSVDDIIGCDDGRWLVVGKLKLHGRKLQTELDPPVALIIGLRDGLIAKVETYPNRVEAAYESAGIEPPA